MIVDLEEDDNGCFVCVDPRVLGQVSDTCLLLGKGKTDPIEKG